MKIIRTAKELLISYLEQINDPDKAIELFADDATIELPYLRSAGMHWQWQGKEVNYNFLKGLSKTLPDFRVSNIQVHIGTPYQAFGEYEAHSSVASTGWQYHQSYMGRLAADNGKIKLLREALDMAQVDKSMNPAQLNSL